MLSKKKKGVLTENFLSVMRVSDLGFLALSLSSTSLFCQAHHYQNNCDSLTKNEMKRREKQHSFMKWKHDCECLYVLESRSSLQFVVKALTADA